MMSRRPAPAKVVHHPRRYSSGARHPGHPLRQAAPRRRRDIPANSIRTVFVALRKAELRRKRNPLERDIKAGVLEALSFCHRLRLWNAPCGVGRTLDGKRVVRYGTPGMADLTGVLAPNGLRIEIEIKTPRGRLSAAQAAFRKAIWEAGGIYLVFRSVEEAMERTKSLGWWDR